MRKLFSIGALGLLAVGVHASPRSSFYKLWHAKVQSQPSAASTIPAPPVDFVSDLPSYQAQAGQALADALANWVWAKNSLVTLGNNQAADEQNIQSLLSGQSAASQTIAGLQAQLNAQSQIISALQAQLAELAAPLPVQTTLAFTNCPDGPLNGLFQGINFGTGFWVCINGELAAGTDGQTQRSVVFPRPVAILSFTFSTTNAETMGITLTSASGQIATASVAAVNEDTTFAPGWSTPTPSFTVGGSKTSTSLAPDLRIRQLVYQ